jgi:hypothetical protein
MAPNPRRIHARLDGLYARLPHLDCQGVCTDSCGPIPAGQHERARIERARGRPLDAPEHVSRVGQVMEACHECSMLENGRCSVYEIRPMNCRLWGVTEDMPCPYGCVPEGGRLSVGDGYAFLAEAFAIAGWPPGWASYAKQEIRRLAADPRARRLMLNHHRPTLAGRRASTKPTVIERGYRG